MTGTPFDDGKRDQAAELMLRERFEATVGGLSPDIGRLVADGTAEGRGAVRRRRIISGLAAAAVAIVAVGSISYASQSDLFGKGDHATNNGLIQLVPATPRGLAAALLSHTESLGTPLAVGGTKRAGTSDFSGQVAYDLGGGTGVEFDVYATPDTSGLTDSGGDACAADQSAFDVCRPFTLPDGTKAWYSEIETAATGDDGPLRLASVVALREDQLVAVVETMNGSTELVLDQDALAAIVADPAIGLLTSPAFNAAGDQIADFREDGLITSDSGSSSGSSSGGGSASPPTVESQSAPTSSSASSGSGRSH